MKLDNTFMFILYMNIYYNLRYGLIKVLIAYVITNYICDKISKLMHHPSNLETKKILKLEIQNILAKGIDQICLIMMIIISNCVKLKICAW